MARSSRYYPPRIGVHRGTWEGDLDGRESPCGWDCERRICESFFFSKLSHEQFHSYTLLLTSVNGFALIRLPFIPLFILSLLYYELLWFSFLPLSLSPSVFCLLCTTEGRFGKERALKFPRHSDTSDRFPPMRDKPRFHVRHVFSAYLHIHSYNFEIPFSFRERDR